MRMPGIKRILAPVAIAMALVVCGCASNQGGAVGDSVGTSKNTAAAQASTAAKQTSTAYRYASESEGRDLLMSNEEYLAGFSQNDLDFRMQKSGATMYLSAEALDELVSAENEDEGAAAETDGEDASAEEDDDEYIFDLTPVLWHELFHCLTRCNPDFRADMYKIIHFTVHDTDYALPPSVVEYHISNPDVEHHDSSATFTIGEKDVECFTDFVTTQHFQEEGDNFFDFCTTALVPVDGTDVYYTPDQAANFDEVFGRNTEYVVDPEECMADNFSFALFYGTEGEDGNGYESPQIIDGILAYLQQP